MWRLRGQTSSPAAQGRRKEQLRVRGTVSVQSSQVIDASAAEGAVAADAAGEGETVGDEEDEDPETGDGEFPDQLGTGVAAEHDGRREVGEVTERKVAAPSRDRFGEPIERDHMPGEEEVDHHIDEEKTADFKEPESDEADEGFHEEADEEGEEEREEKCSQHGGIRPAGEVFSEQPEDESEGADGNGVIDEFVGDAVPEEEAQHVDGLGEVFFYGAVADVASDAAGEAGHA